MVKKEDVLEVIKKLFREELDKLPGEIDEDGHEVIADMKTANLLLHLNKELRMRIKGLQPVVQETEEIKC